MIRDAKEAGQLHKPHFTCATHKDYRVYQDELLKFSDWAIVLTTILAIPIIWPLTAIANNLDLDLVAIFKLFAIPVNSGWVPLCLAICWPAASSVGIIAGLYFASSCQPVVPGAISGLLGGLLVWLISCSSIADGEGLQCWTDQDTH
jgi:hypothetical protein